MEQQYAISEHGATVKLYFYIPLHSNYNFPSIEKAIHLRLSALTEYRRAPIDQYQTITQPNVDIE
jgi:hypothetical protein